MNYELDYRDLKGEMPLAAIEQALDDNSDGIADEDAWQSVLAGAEARIDAALGDTDPSLHVKVVDNARRLFCLESLYNRRGFADARNPYTSRASAAEKRLMNLASGDETTSGSAPGMHEGKPAKIANTSGLLA